MINTYWDRGVQNETSVCGADTNTAVFGVLIYVQPFLEQSALEIPSHKS